MNQLECDVAEWLLQHKDGLLSELEARHNINYQLFPDSLFYIYLDQYEQGALSIVQNKIVESFNTNLEDVSFLTKDFVVKLLGVNFLQPKKE